MRKEFDNGWVATSDNNIVVGGRISYNSFQECRGMRDMIESAVHPGITIDVRPVEFISSSVIATMAFIIRRCRENHFDNMSFMAKSSHDQQGRLAGNLQRIMPGLNVIGLPKTEEDFSLPL